MVFPKGTHGEAGKWIRFDDDKVEEVSWDVVQEDAKGGTYYSGNKVLPRLGSALMLLYDRMDKDEAAAYLQSLSAEAGSAAEEAI